MDFGLGWNPDSEQQHANAFSALFQPLCAASERIPDNVDPRGKLPVFNQGPFNSCEGAARSKVTSFINWIKTGESIALSPRFSYLTSKIVDQSDPGTDGGASISGGGLASTKFGECIEANCPYWTWDWEQGGVYDPSIPQPALDQGAEHKLRSFSPIRSYEDWINGIGLGLGGVLFGVLWTTGLRDCQGEYSNLGGARLGGHAQAGLGYVMRGGEKWPIVFNSHGLPWGDQTRPEWRGTAVMPPKVCDWICRNSPYPPILMSDLPVFRQRKFHDFTGVVPCSGILPHFSHSQSA